MVAQTLRGELVIEHLERVENLMEAKEALISKRNLHSLALASWMSASVLRTMIILYLHDCTYCLHLSQLAQLPCLKYLSLRWIHLEYIDTNVESGISQLRKFPSLESLEMCKLSNLKGVSIEGEEEQFPSLHEMWIEDWPLLTFPCLLSLRTFRIMKCSNMTLASISNLCGLTCLEIGNNKELDSFPEEVLTNLTDLEILTIDDFSKLEVLPSSLASLTALKSLRIGHCHLWGLAPFSFKKRMLQSQERCCKLQMQFAPPSFSNWPRERKVAIKFSIYREH